MGSNVRYGSSAEVQVNSSAMTAYGGKAEVRIADNHDFEGPLSAQSGPISQKFRRSKLALTAVRQFELTSVRRRPCGTRRNLRFRITIQRLKHAGNVLPY